MSLICHLATYLLLLGLLSDPCAAWASPEPTGATLMVSRVNLSLDSIATVRPFSINQALKENHRELVRRVESRGYHNSDATYTKYGYDLYQGTRIIHEDVRYLKLRGGIPRFHREPITGLELLIKW